MQPIRNILNEDTRALRAYDKILDKTSFWTEEAQRKFVCSRVLLPYFRQVRLSGVPIFPMTGWDFKRKVLDGAYFRDLDLRKCDFRSSSLVGADFRGARLTRTDFRKATITGCSFQEAHLYRADFRKTMGLDSTDFTSANTRGLLKDPGVKIPRERRETTVSSVNKTVYVLCPDDHLENERGEYRFSPEGSYRAWASCYQGLGSVIREHKDETIRVTLLSGVQGSGKTTYRKHELKRLLVDEDVHVVFDATFATKISRSAILNLCRGLGVRVGVVFMDTPLSICLSRNSSRSRDRRIPATVVYKTSEFLVVPSEGEGFDNVKIVRGV